MTDNIILHQHRTWCNNLTITFSDAMYNETLIAIKDISIIVNLPLINIGILSPNRSASDLMNPEMIHELQYNVVEMAAIFSRNIPLLNEEQRIIYEQMMLTLSVEQGEFFFGRTRWNWQNIPHFANSRRNTMK